MNEKNLKIEEFECWFLEVFEGKIDDFYEELVDNISSLKRYPII